VDPVVPPQTEPTIDVEHVDKGLAVASLHGEHDLHSAPELRECISRLFGEGSSVVVDLSGAALVDSSILAVLAAARAVSRGSDLGFALLVDEHTASPVRRAVEVTGLTRVLRVLESRGALGPTLLH
jgi:anti-sigma B factor antagonist